MKYMGSKRQMLRNGLGSAIEAEATKAGTFYDLFTGSASVAWHVAQKFEKTVVAVDLQSYSAALAEAVLSRTEPISGTEWLDDWLKESRDRREGELWDSASRATLRMSVENIGPVSEDFRSISVSARGSITKAYGGYYYSPLQSLTIDSLRSCLPEGTRGRLGLAALIVAASRAAASPGHTAQPFKPNKTAGPYLFEAWGRDVEALLRAAVSDIGGRFAKQPGRALVKNAIDVVSEVKEGDLAFIDPPYSGVHYSRFYHVLESVARGDVGTVSGAGRYPPSDERPTSDYSIGTKSLAAIDKLFSELARRGATAIVTFPAGATSNGLGGDKVQGAASKYFKIKEEIVSSRFSTLGGNRRHREARQAADELILTLIPN